MKKKKNNKTMILGYHLLLDGYNCNPKKLNDMDLVFDVLNRVPEKIKMRKITTPYVIKVEGNEKNDPGGYSGYVMIADSHISVHTFVKRGFVSIDVYSCKKFDPKPCVKYFKKNFNIKNIEDRFIKRATQYPTKNLY